VPARRGGRLRCRDRQARARFAAFERPAHSVFATFKYLRGVSLMERNEAAAARPWLEESLALFDKAPDRNPLRVRALALLALCLDDLGEPAKARETAALAVDTARRNTAGVKESEWVGSALLVQARVHERQGDLAGARAMATEAKRHLEPDARAGGAGAAQVGTVAGATRGLADHALRILFVGRRVDHEHLHRLVTDDGERVGTSGGKKQQSPGPSSQVSPPTSARARPCTM
jgi:tetratricopeptide (TPR) repeat protein